MNDKFFLGFTYPFKCIGLFFKQPKLITYSIAPIIINLIIYGSIFILSYRWLIDWIRNINEGSPAGVGFWAILLQIFLISIGFAVLLVICGLLFTTLGGIITAPFNENISQIVEEKITNEKVITGIGFWKDTYLSIRGELQKILFYFAILFVIFLLNFIPLIGNAASLVLGTLFSFYFYALDFLDYPMQRKLMSFRQKLKITRRGGMLTCGFGAIAFLLMYLPVINVFMKPVLVAAGTKLYWENRTYLYDGDKIRKDQK